MKFKNPATININELPICAKASVFFLSLLLLISVSLLPFSFMELRTLPLAHANPNPIYLDIEMSQDNMWANSDISLEFTPNERLCKHHYGDNWYEKCYAWIGKHGTVIQEFDTTNWPEGEWVWVSPNSAEFTPTGYWKSNTTYSIDLSKLSLPSHITLMEEKPNFTTRPRGVYVSQSRLWIDPSSKAEHGISFALRFTESIEENVRAYFQENVWPTPKNSPGLKLSQGEWVWLDDNTRAVVNTRILNLPKEKSMVELTVPSARHITQEHERWYFSNNNAQQNLVIPGTNSIFEVKKAYLETKQNKSLQMEQHLVFSFSQRVEPEELINALTVLELPLYRSEENIIKTDWNEGVIGQDVRQKARKLTPEWVRTADISSGENGDIIRLRLNVQEGHYILWELPAGFGPTNDKGIKTPLQETIDGIAFVSTGSPRLEFLQTGTVLMQDSNIALVSEHLDSIRWSAHRIMDTALALPFMHSLDHKFTPDERNAISIVSRGEIPIKQPLQSMSAKSTDSAENSAQTEPSALTIQDNSREPRVYSTPVFTTLEAKDIFGMKAENKSPTKNTQTQNPNVQSSLIYLHIEGIKDNRVIEETGRFLMYSNMGLVLKRLPNKTMEAYVAELDTANPLQDVLIQVIGFNGLAVYETKTDRTGKALLPDMSHFSEEKQAVAIIARRLNADILSQEFTQKGEQKNEQEIAQKNAQAITFATEDMLWISLQDYARYINVSNFADITGKRSSVNLLNAFVFAERGFFRPGENLNFATLLRGNDWKLLPKDMPLVATIIDASNRKVFEKIFKAGDNIHSFTWEIPTNAITGKYRLNISTPTSQSRDTLGLLLGSSTVQVETFLPDTLRMKTELVAKQASGKTVPLEENFGWVQTSPNTSIFNSYNVHEDKAQANQVALQVQLDTLYGQAAQNRRITATMQLSPAYLAFKGYEDYIFQDVSPYFGKGTAPITRPLKPTTTNDLGEATIPLDFSQWRFGTLQCSIVTEGYEPAGGRAVSQKKNFLLSPMPYMLGYKLGEGADNKDFILKNSHAKLLFQAINEKLEGINTGELIFSISKRKSVQSLVSDSLGQYTYAETMLETEISQEYHELSATGKLTWKIPTHEVGDYVLTVKVAPSKLSPSDNEISSTTTNTATYHDVNKQTQNMQNEATQSAINQEITNQDATTMLAQISYSVVGNDDLRPALRHNYQLPKAHLHIKTDKAHYDNAETVKIMITAPYEGLALISLERDKVEAYKWVHLPLGASIHELEIPQDFIGRGYIQVLMGRAPQSDAIFLQSQSLGMASIVVNTKEREIPLEIIANEKVRPAEMLHVHIKNISEKPMKAVLYAVDEGILQLSQYITPDPLQYLLLDRDLEVRTAQLFDRFMAQDDKILKRLSAFGGGMMSNDLMLASRMGSFQNPFKRETEAPMSWWSEVIDIPADGLDMEIPIPEYFNGAVRLIIVAHNEEAVGYASANVLVQDEQVFTTQVPTMLAVGDSFVGGVGISNTTDKPLTLQTNIALTPTSNVQDILIRHFPSSITLAPKEEKFITFEARVGQEAGSAVFCFTTENEDGEIRSRTVSTSVRPTTQPRYSQQSFVLRQSSDISSSRSLLPYEAQTSLTVSPVPIPLLQSSLNYLKNYPYNCVEQSISKAFPLVMLSAPDVKTASLASVLAKNVTSLTGKEKEAIIKNAHNALMLAFNPYEGVSLWETTARHDIFLTTYAADYVLALKEAGMPVPPNLLPQLFNTLQRHINTSPSSLRELRNLAYASWVLARAGYVVSRQLELCENFIRNENLERSDIYQTLMAGAYHALYMEESAKKHLQNVIGQENSNQKRQDSQTKQAQYGLSSWVQNSAMFDLLAQYGLHARVLAKHFPQIFHESLSFLEARLMEGLNKSHATLGASMAALGLMSIVETLPESSLNMENLALTCKVYDRLSEDNTASAELFAAMQTLHAPLCETFNVEFPSGDIYFAQVEYYGYDAQMPTKAEHEGVRIAQKYSFDVQYTNEEDTQKIDPEREEFKNIVTQGEILRVDVDVDLLSDDEFPIAILSLLPGGFEFVLNHKDDSTANEFLSFVREEDRVIAFIDATNKKKRITYHIRATAQGDFAIPPAHAEGLFDRTLQSHTAGSRMRVVAP